MVHLGNHLKMTLDRSLRGRARDFYLGMLECKVLVRSMPDLDLYEFAGGDVPGAFSEDEPEMALSEEDHVKAAWLETKVLDIPAWKAKLQAFGAREVAFPDPVRFFVQTPGGQVFTLAP